LDEDALTTTTAAEKVTNFGDSKPQQECYRSDLYHLWDVGKLGRATCFIVHLLHWPLWSLFGQLWLTPTR
jgi:hypothetical protein